MFTGITSHHPVNALIVMLPLQFNVGQLVSYKIVCAPDVIRYSAGLEAFDRLHDWLPRQHFGRKQLPGVKRQTLTLWKIIIDDYICVHYIRVSFHLLLIWKYWLQQPQHAAALITCAGIHLFFILFSVRKNQIQAPIHQIADLLHDVRLEGFEKTN